MIVTMIIIWSILIAVSLLIEFLINDMTAVWFAAGGIAGLICAPFGMPWYWQVLVVVAVSFIFLLSLRPIVKKYIKTKTVPTNVDAEVGKQVKLLKDVQDGTSEIKIGDTFWRVKCDEDLKSGDTVEIVGMDGNKYIVKKGETK